MHRRDPVVVIAVVVAVGMLASCSGGGKSAHVPPELRSALTSASPVTDVAAVSDQETHALLDDVGLRAKFGANADSVYSLLDKARKRAVEAEPVKDTTS